MLLSFIISFYLTNERPALADREPHPQHVPPLHRAHFRDDFRVGTDFVQCLLGSHSSRRYFASANSRYGLNQGEEFAVKPYKFGVQRVRVFRNPLLINLLDLTDVHTLPQMKGQEFGRDFNARILENFSVFST